MTHPPASHRGHRDLPVWAFVLAAAGLPWLLLCLHHGLGHQGDMRFFHAWFRAVQESNAFYRDGPGVNYPVLGVLAVSLPAWLVEAVSGRTLEFAGYRLVLKTILVLAECGLVLSLGGLARELGARRPRLLALGVYLLPSTWAGGAWFGQIDVLGTWMLVIAARGFVRFAAVPHTRFLATGLTGLHAAVLTKQLTLFSVPGLALLAGLGVARAGRSLSTGRTAGLVLAAVLSCAVWFLPDPFLELGRGWWSHLGYVLFGGGSAHGNVLSGNGANIWGWLCADPDASALQTVWLGLSARAWGWLLFALVEAGLLAWLVRTRQRDPAVRLVLFVGLTNLAMAVLLTGVHERYLVHGAPFLVTGLVLHAWHRGRWGRRLAITGWVVTGWSGLFVLSSIHWESFGGVLAPFRSHAVTGALELGLLAGCLIWAGWEAVHAGPGAGGDG